MTLLTTGNSKLMKTGKKHNAICAVFSLPAQATCPRAGVCRKYCYASYGTYLFRQVFAHAHGNFRASKRDDFVALMQVEIDALRRKAKGRNIYVRLHDSGDFYNATYIHKWTQIVANNPDVEFYAYSKSHVNVSSSGLQLFCNWTLIPSQGGKDDTAIKGPCAIVVPTGTTRLPANTVFGDAGDDLYTVKMVRQGKSVALVAHGVAKRRVV